MNRLSIDSNNKNSRKFYQNKNGQKYSPIQISNMHVRIRIDSLRNSRFIRLSVPIRVYTIDYRVDRGKIHSYIHNKAIYEDQTDCMSFILPFKLFFSKITSVDFLESRLTRQLACM